VEKQIEKISVVSVAPLLAQAIRHVHVGKSLATLV
jgi:phosphoribosylpyrophosphate synthetase